MGLRNPNETGSTVPRDCPNIELEETLLAVGCLVWEFEIGFGEQFPASPIFYELSRSYLFAITMIALAEVDLLVANLSPTPPATYL